MNPIRVGVVLAVAGALICGVAPAAVAEGGSRVAEGGSRAAAGGSRLAAVKAAGAAAIAARQAILGTDDALAASATHLPGGVGAELQSLVEANESGLDQLGETINADTQVSQAIADVESIVTSYRIYTLVGPKVSLVVADDHGAAVLTEFGPLTANLQTAITQAAAAGRDVSGAQGLLSQLQGDVAAATAIVSEAPGQVLPLTPAGYPANRSTLVAAAGSLGTARADLEQAAADAQGILGDVGGP